MGVTEEGGKVVTSFMDSLKSQPLSLALVVMNLALLGFFYTILTAVAAQRDKEVGLLYADHKEVRELLAHCVVPPRVNFTPIRRAAAAGGSVNSAVPSDEVGSAGTTFHNGELE